MLIKSRRINRVFTLEIQYAHLRKDKGVFMTKKKLRSH